MIHLFLLVLMTIIIYLFVLPSPNLKSYGRARVRKVLC